MTGARRTILNVNSDDTGLHETSEILRQAGFEVIEAPTGTEALQLAMQRPDAIVLDIDLSDIDGPEFCRRLSELPQAANIPILKIATTLKDTEAEVESPASGAIGYLTRPVEPSVLTTYIHALLRTKTADLEETPILDSISEIIAYHDRNHVIQWANQAYQDATGLSLDELKGRACYQAWGLKRICDHCPVSAAIELGEACEAELTPQNQEHWPADQGSWLVRADPVRDEDGIIIGAIEVAADITDRKRAEAELRESEERFRALAMSAPVGIFQADLRGTGTYFNETICQFTGLRPEAHVGDGWIKAIHPDDLRHTQEAWRKTVQGESDFRGEFRFVSRQGDVTWVSSSAVALTDSSGEISGFIGTLTDITERKHVEEERDTILELSSDLICIAGVDGYFKYVNPAWERTLGYATQELLARPFLDFIHPDDHTKNDTEVEKLRCGEPTIDFENRYIAKDGSTHTIAWAATPVPETGLLYCVGRDVTERKRAEEDIRNLARFPSESPYPVLRIRSDGTILHANPVAARLLADHELSPDGQAPDCWQECAALAMESGTVVRKEFHYGQETFAFHFVPLADAGYVNVYGIDITEQKDLEAQLRQAQKMEAIGRLAGGIAHDFRNQLTVITGYADWMLSHMDDDNQYAQYVHQIFDAAKRSTRLTGHLLAFSRREILEPQIVGPMALVDSLVEPLKHMIGEDVVLVTSGGDDLDNITVDPSQFEHMLVNLAVNARDAMPNGGDLRIDVTSTELDSKSARRNIDASPGKYVTITVADTGVGMDAETCRNAFDPFFTTKPVGEGTGVGLAMVYGFVRQSGGYITLHSEVGHGTTFKIYLPTTTEPPKETGSPVEAEDTTGDRATATILVVEDDEQLRNMLADILRKGGHTVLTAGNAREALPIGEHYEEQIDLLITDVVMPGMSGVELAEKLKAVRPDMAVLLISGYGDSELLRRGLAADNTELLLKPFGADKLLSAVNRMLA